MSAATWRRSILVLFRHTDRPNPLVQARWLLWIGGRQWRRALTDRLHRSPVIVLLPLGLAVAWYLGSTTILRHAQPTSPDIALGVTHMVHAGAFAAVFALAVVVDALRCLKSKGDGGLRCLPIIPVVRALYMALPVLLGGLVLGMLLTLPVTVVTSLPQLHGRDAGVWTHFLVGISWLAASAAGLAWSVASRRVSLSMFARQDRALCEIGYLVLAGSGIAAGACASLWPTATLLHPVVTRIVHHGVHFPRIEVALILLASALLVALHDIPDLGLAASRVVPLRSLRFMRGNTGAAFSLTVRGMVRNTWCLPVSLFAPGVLLGVAVVIRTVPSLRALAPLVSAVAVFVVPASAGLLPLATDLFKLQARWLSGLPLHPARFGVGEAAAATLVTVAVAVPSAMGLLAILETRVNSLLELSFLILCKSLAMAGLSLALTSVTALSSKDSGSGEIVFPLVLYTLGCGLIESGFWFAAAWVRGWTAWIVVVSIPVIVVGLGMFCRTLAVNRRFAHARLSD
jgi:hypothetical protein